MFPPLRILIDDEALFLDGITEGSYKERDICDRDRVYQEISDIRKGIFLIERLGRSGYDVL